MRSADDDKVVYEIQQSINQSVNQSVMQLVTRRRHVSV